MQKNIDDIVNQDDLKLNIGSGDTVFQGYLNIDKVQLPGVDMLWDLEETPLPFKDNSVIEIRAEHILEHITNYMPLLEELHRISKPDAKLHILAPYFKYEAAYRDPTHVRFFTEHSFDYFSEGVKFSHYTAARFKVEEVEKRVRYLSDVKNRQKKIIARIPNFLRPALDIFFWNIYTELRYELGVVK